MKKKEEHSAVKKEEHSAVKPDRGAESFYPLGFHVHQIRPDGNCLYRSLSHQIHHDEDSMHETYRRQIAVHMRTHKDDYIKFYVPKIRKYREERSKIIKEREETYEEYVDRMETTNSWGGELELNAAADVTGYIIDVYQDNNTPPRRFSPSGESKGTLNLLYSAAGRHYESLVGKPVPPENRRTGLSKNRPKTSSRHVRFRRKIPNTGAQPCYEEVVFEVHELKGDGSCLYRGIAHQLGEDDDVMHSTYRQKISEYMKKNKRRFSRYVPAKDKHGAKQTFDEYCSRMLDQTEWGGKAELFAAASLTRCTIHVYEKNATEPRVFEPYGGRVSRSTLSLLYDGTQHYESLIEPKKDRGEVDVLWWDYENVPVPYNIEPKEMFEILVSTLRDAGWGRDRPLEVRIVVGYSDSTLPDFLFEKPNVVIIFARNFPRPKGISTKANQVSDEKLQLLIQVSIEDAPEGQKVVLLSGDQDFQTELDLLTKANHETMIIYTEGASSEKLIGAKEKRSLKDILSLTTKGPSKNKKTRLAEKIQADKEKRERELPEREKKKKEKAKEKMRKQAIKNARKRRNKKANNNAGNDLAGGYQGVSLSTISRSSVVINPEAKKLKSWYESEGEETSMSSIGSGMSSSAWSIPLSEITSNPSLGEEKPVFFSTRGYISFFKPDQTVWYHACNKKVTEAMDSGNWCESCYIINEEFGLRYIMVVKVSDSTGEARFSSFNDEAEKIIGCSADELNKQRSEGGEVNEFQTKLKEATWSSHVFRISVTQKELTDVIGFVQSVHPTMSIRRRTDSEMIPKTVVMSLWNNLANGTGQELLDMADNSPVIAIKSLKVGDLQGVSLSTISRSSVVINPEAKKLKSRYESEGKETSMSSIGSGMSSSAKNGVKIHLLGFTVNDISTQSTKYFLVTKCGSVGFTLGLTDEEVHDRFQLKEVYYISRGSLKLAKRFKTVGNDYEMTLNEDSEVEEAGNEEMLVPETNFNFVPIEELGMYVNQEFNKQRSEGGEVNEFQTKLKEATWSSHVFRISVTQKELTDVIGVVQSVHPTMSIRRRTDSEMIPKTVVMSLWNNLANGTGQELLDMADNSPVIAIKSLKVGDLQGVSLSTISRSSVAINPESPEAKKLKSWYESEGKETSMSSIGSGMSPSAKNGVEIIAPVDFAAVSRLLLQVISKKKKA